MMPLGMASVGDVNTIKKITGKAPGEYRDSCGG